MSNKRLAQLIDSGCVPFMGGICLDCYNQSWQKVHITVTARYDDGNKFVTQCVETE